MLLFGILFILTRHSGKAPSHPNQIYFPILFTHMTVPPPTLAIFVCYAKSVRRTRTPSSQPDEIFGRPTNHRPVQQIRLAPQPQSALPPEAACLHHSYGSI